MLLFLLLTGCTVEYDVSYYDGIYNEESNIKSTLNEYCGESLCKDLIYQFYTSNFSIDYNDSEEDLALGVNLDKYTFYNKEYNNEFMKVKYSFDSLNYKYSSVVNKLFNKFYVTNNYIEASGIKDIFSIYPNLTQIKIGFETDKNILESNHDELKNNKYYWYITKDNYKNRVINIKFDTSEVKMVEDGYFTWHFIKYFLMILLVIVLLSVIIIYEKVMKSNN